MAAAKARGIHIGRPRKLTDQQIAYARALIAAKESTITAMAKKYGVAPQTLSRWVCLPDKI